MRKSRGMSSRPWSVLRRQALERDDWQCVKCKRPGRLEVDHVIPIQDGGSNELDNLQTLCRGCHIDKSRQEVYNRSRTRYAPGFEKLMEAYE